MVSKDINEDMAELTRFEAEAAKLKSVFDFYFLGIEKKPPLDEWERLKKEARALLTRKSNNTGYKFRRQSVSQKFGSQSQYYERILKQIEDGTYARHKFLAKLHESERAAHASPAKPGAPPAAAGPPKAAASDGGGLDSVYGAYIAARQKTGEATNIPKDKLAQVIAQQTAAIKEKYKCKDVEFKVAIEGGKTKLKAVPRN